MDVSIFAAFLARASSRFSRLMRAAACSRIHFHAFRDQEWNS